MKSYEISNVLWRQEGFPDVHVFVTKTFLHNAKPQYAVQIKERRSDGRLHMVEHVTGIIGEEAAANFAVTKGAELNAQGYFIVTA